MKKISAILLALVMLLSMTAMAASITITGADLDGGSDTPVYAAYKVFDATINGDKVSYTIDTDNQFYSTIAAATTYFKLDKAPGTDKTYVVTVLEAYTDDVANTFADTLKAVATTTSGTVTNNVISGLTDGYYLVTSNVGSDLILDTIGDITVNTKNAYPTIGKTVETLENTTADMGEVLPFAITVTIPEDAIGEIVVHDNMTGLEYVDMTAVQGITVAKNVADGCEVEFTLSDAYVAANKGTTITINYTAKVTAEIAKNEAYLTDATYTSKTVDNDIYSADILINKVEKGTTTALEGAKFVLKNAEGKFYAVDANGDVSWVDTQAEATEVTTDANGAAEFANIAAGTYYLVETEAPAGYNLLTAPQEVVVTATPNAENTAVIDITATVENSTGSTLPSTGGMGTTIFYVVGGLMMAAAVVLLVAKKKVSA